MEFTDIDVEHSIVNCNEYNTIENFILEVSPNTYLCFIHLNIRSIRKHWDELMVCMNEVIICIDVLVLTEIGISENENSLYDIAGFNSMIYNREGQRGGGLVLYIKSGIEVEQISMEKAKMESFEGLLGIIKIEEHVIHITAIYRPPRENILLFLQEIESIIRNIGGKTDAILIGDLNIDLSKDLRSVNEYKNLLAQWGMINVICGFTREEIMGNIMVRSSIDHIFTRTNNSVKSSIIETKLTDHYMVAALVNMGVNNIKAGNNKNKKQIKYDEKYVRKELCKGKLGDIYYYRR